MNHRSSVDGGVHSDASSGLYDNASQLLYDSCNNEDQHTIFATKTYRYIDCLESNEAGEVLICSSGLSSKIQDGIIAVYSSFSDLNCGKTLPLPTNPLPVHTEAGVTSAKWLNETDFILSSESGGLETWKCAPRSLDNDDGSGDGGGNILRHLWTKYAHDDVTYKLDTVCSNCDNAVTSSGDGTVKLWDLKRAQIIRTLNGHSDIVWCVRCHPSDDNLMISCSQDKQVILWDLRKSKPGLILDSCIPSRADTAAVSAAWQPDNKYRLALGFWSGHIMYKDVRRDKKDVITTTRPHFRPVNQVEFNPSHSDVVASVSDDCSVAVTQFTGNKSRQIYLNKDAHEDMVRDVCWETSDTFYTCGWDGVVNKHVLNTNGL